MLHPSHCFRTCHRVARSMLGFCRYAARTSRPPRHVSLVGPSPVQRQVEVQASAGRRSNSSREADKPPKKQLPGTFQQLGVPPPLLDALAAANITAPTEIQVGGRLGQPANSGGRSSPAVAAAVLMRVGVVAAAAATIPSARKAVGGAAA